MRDPSWDNPLLQDAWTQAFRYSNRRQEMYSRRAVSLWEVEISRSKASLLEAAHSTSPFIPLT